MLPNPLVSIAALALVAAAPPPSAVPTVTVALDNFSIRPQPLHLAAGQRVRLLFVNRSGSGHDFTARKFFAGARILDGAPIGGRIELAGHQSAAIELVPTRGRFKAHCSHFGHRPLGMASDLLVD